MAGNCDDQKPGRADKDASVTEAGLGLERLEADEARAVLHRLLTAHPDLRTEAEQAARSLLSQVSFVAAVRPLR